MEDLISRDVLSDQLYAAGSKLSNNTADWVEKLDSLCSRCEHSQIMRKKGDRHYNTYCHNFSQFVAPLDECSAFSEQNKLTLREMTDIAGLINTKDKVGFKS